MVDSKAHNLCPMPTFSANAGSIMPLYVTNQKICVVNGRVERLKTVFSLSVIQSFAECGNIDVDILKITLDHTKVTEKFRELKPFRTQI